MSLNLDYMFHIEDEIALEGLDGVTIQALWLRLSKRAGFTDILTLDDDAKKFCWSFIVSNKEIAFYLLETPRPPLEILDLYSYVDPDLGVIIEPDAEMEDIYPYCPVEVKNEVRGSCHNFDTRKDISDIVRSLCLGEVSERYENLLVMVASQAVRNKALGIDLCIDNFYDLSLMQYTLLERIARSRTMGGLTRGKAGLRTLAQDSKSLFYYLKRLLKLNLITKQVHHQKLSNGTIGHGALIHLKRFYVERKSKFMLITEKLTELLKQSPNFSLPLNEAMQKLELDVNKKCIKKCRENSEFCRTFAVKTIGYYEAYPDALKTNKQKIKTKKQKRVFIVVLKNPNAASFDLDNNDNEENNYDDDNLGSGILDTSRQYKGFSLIHQACNLIRSAGLEGLNQKQIGKALGLSHLNSRRVCKILSHLKAVVSVLKDVKKQRTLFYISSEFANNDMNEFNNEKKKMCLLMKLSDQMKIDKEQNYSISSELLDSTEFEVTETNLPQKNVLTISALIDSPVTKDDEQTNSDGKSAVALLNESSDIQALFKSTRVIKRANFIIEKIKELRVCEFIKLHRLIIEEEESSSKDGIIDRKTVLRLLLKLAQQNLVKYLKVKLKFENWVRMLFLIAHPSVSSDDPLVVSYIERQKTKFLLIYDAKNKAKEDVSHSPSKSMDLLNINQTAGKEDSNQRSSEENDKLLVMIVKHPKFLRLMEFHKFLIYLVWDYNGDVNMDQAEGCQRLQDFLFADINSGDCKDLPKMYSSSLSWNMFVPPLPNYDGIEKGWLLVSDLILCLPLCIFVKTISLYHLKEEIDQLLKHPIKSNILIKDLPHHSRTHLIKGRRYIASIFDSLNYLCYMGLIQYGCQSQKHRESSYVYVNKSACLYDTSISDPGYLYVTANKDYSLSTYSFETLDDAAKYWYDLWRISMNTRLGGYSYVTDRKGGTELVNKKPLLIETLKQKSFEEAPKLDCGYIPGDHRGAGGLDSAMFSHLKRNWTTAQTISRMTMNEKKETVHSALQHCSKYLIGSICSIPNPLKQWIEGMSAKSDLFNEEIEKSFEIKSALFTKQHGSSKRKQEKQTKEVGAKESTGKNTQKRKEYDDKEDQQKKKLRKPYIDPVDELALSLMDKPRVDWSPAEDSFLLLCKVAARFLSPVFNKQLATYAIIRNLLHEHFPLSRNKTSRACQRRSLYIMKNKTTTANVSVFLEEVKQDHSIMGEFGKITSPANKEDAEKYFGLVFSQLVSQLLIKFGAKKKGDFDVPSTLHDFKKFYKIVSIKQLADLGSYWKEVRSTKDIEFSVIMSLIFSSLCGHYDKASYAYQLYLAYQQYPQSLLNEVLVNIRHSKMISYKRLYSKSQLSKNCLPLSVSPFQLSVMYYNIFLMQSRLSLFMLRDQLNHEDIDASSMQGVLDAFSIVGCKVKCAFKDSVASHKIEEADKVLTFEDFSLLSQTDVNMTLEIRQRSIVTKFEGTLSDAVEKWKNANLDELTVETMKDIYSFIFSWEVLGAPFYKIKEKFGMMCKFLTELENEGLILKVGVAVIRYVAVQHCLPWLLRTPKIPNKERQEGPVFRIKGVYQLDKCQTENERSDSESVAIEKSNDEDYAVKAPIFIKDSLTVDNKEFPSLVTSSSAKNWEKIEQVSACKGGPSQQNSSKLQNKEIFVKIRPWIRLNGCVNRRVLDRLLLSILTYIMGKPGIFAYAICEKFWPALLPAQTYELLDTLCSLKCLRKCHLSKSHKLDLFSDIPTYSIDTVEDWDYDDHNILYEPTVDCILKLGQFIGDKKYLMDFLSHPR